MIGIDFVENVSKITFSRENGDFFEMMYIIAKSFEKISTL